MRELTTLREKQIVPFKCVCACALSLSTNIKVFTLDSVQRGKIDRKSEVSDSHPQELVRVCGGVRMWLLRLCYIMKFKNLYKYISYDYSSCKEIS